MSTLCALVYSLAALREDFGTSIGFPTPFTLVSFITPRLHCNVSDPTTSVVHFAVPCPNQSWSYAILNPSGLPDCDSLPISFTSCSVTFTANVTAGVVYAFSSGVSMEVSTSTFADCPLQFTYDAAFSISSMSGDASFTIALPSGASVPSAVLGEVDPIFDRNISMTGQGTFSIGTLTPTTVPSTLTFTTDGPRISASDPSFWRGSLTLDTATTFSSVPFLDAVLDALPVPYLAVLNALVDPVQGAAVTLSSRMSPIGMALFKDLLSLPTIQAFFPYLNTTYLTTALNNATTTLLASNSLMGKELRFSLTRSAQVSSLAGGSFGQVFSALQGILNSSILTATGPANSSAIPALNQILAAFQDLLCTLSTDTTVWLGIPIDYVDALDGLTQPQVQSLLQVTSAGVTQITCSSPFLAFQVGVIREAGASWSVSAAAASAQTLALASSGPSLLLYGSFAMRFALLNVGVQLELTGYDNDLFSDPPAQFSLDVPLTADAISTIQGVVSSIESHVDDLVSDLEKLGLSSVLPVSAFDHLFLGASPEAFLGSGAILTVYRILSGGYEPFFPYTAVGPYLLRNGISTDLTQALSAVQAAFSQGASVDILLGFTDHDQAPLLTGALEGVVRARPTMLGLLKFLSGTCSTGTPWSGTLSPLCHFGQQGTSSMDIIPGYPNPPDAATLASTASSTDLANTKNGLKFALDVGFQISTDPTTSTVRVGISVSGEIVGIFTVEAQLTSAGIGTSLPGSPLNTTGQNPARDLVTSIQNAYGSLESVIGSVFEGSQSLHAQAYILLKATVRLDTALSFRFVLSPFSLRFSASPISMRIKALAAAAAAASLSVGSISGSLSMAGEVSMDLNASDIANFSSYSTAFNGSVYATAQVSAVVASGSPLLDASASVTIRAPDLSHGLVFGPPEFEANVEPLFVLTIWNNMLTKFQDLLGFPQAGAESAPLTPLQQALQDISNTIGADFIAPLANGNILNMDPSAVASNLVGTTTGAVAAAFDQYIKTLLLNNCSAHVASSQTTINVTLPSSQTHATFDPTAHGAALDMSTQIFACWQLNTNIDNIQALKTALAAINSLPVADAAGGFYLLFSMCFRFVGRWGVGGGTGTYVAIDVVDLELDAFGDLPALQIQLPMIAAAAVVGGSVIGNMYMRYLGAASVAGLGPGAVEGFDIGVDFTITLPCFVTMLTTQILAGQPIIAIVGWTSATGPITNVTLPPVNLDQIRAATALTPANIILYYTGFVSFAEEILTPYKPLQIPLVDVTVGQVFSVVDYLDGIIPYLYKPVSSPVNTRSIPGQSRRRVAAIARSRPGSIASAVYGGSGPSTLANKWTFSIDWDLTTSVFSGGPWSGAITIYYNRADADKALGNSAPAQYALLPTDNATAANFRGPTAKPPPPPTLFRVSQNETTLSSLVTAIDGLLRPYQWRCFFADNGTFEIYPSDSLLGILWDAWVDVDFENLVTDPPQQRPMGRHRLP